jgi:hypothetical protein
MESKDQLELLDVLDLGDSPQPRSDTLERPRLQGQPPKEVFAEYERDLTAADLAALSLPKGTAPRSLVRIHASHHSLARCLATGMKPGQAALVTGYSPSRISILQSDPAFSALVADYQAEAKSAFADLAERMNDLSLDAIEILQERLHDTPEGFTIPVLLDIVKTFADRTGHGPNQEVHLKMSTDLIDRPPRETFEDWQARRGKELEGPGGPTDAPKKLN